jgi:hypothetical protein
MVAAFALGHDGWSHEYVRDEPAMGNQDEVYGGSGAAEDDECLC